MPETRIQSPDRTVIIPVFQVFKNLNEGNLIFSRTGRIPFLNNLDNRVRNFPSDDDLKRYPTKFLEMCQSSVLNDKELEVDFRLLIASYPRSKVTQILKSWMDYSKLWCPS